MRRKAFSLAGLLMTMIMAGAFDIVEHTAFIE